MKKFIIVLLVSTIVVLNGCGKFLEDLAGGNISEVNDKIATIAGNVGRSGVGVVIDTQRRGTFLIKSISGSRLTQTGQIVKVADSGENGSFSFDVKIGNEVNIPTEGENITLESGVYKIEFSKEGFYSKIVDNVPIKEGQGVYIINEELFPIRPDYYMFTPTMNAWVDTKLDVSIGGTVSGRIEGDQFTYVWTDATTPPGRGILPYYGNEGFWGYSSAEQVECALVFKIGTEIISSKDFVLNGFLISPAKGRLYVRVNPNLGIYDHPKVTAMGVVDCKGSYKLYIYSN